MVCGKALWRRHQKIKSKGPQGKIRIAHGTQGHNMCNKALSHAGQADSAPETRVCGFPPFIAVSRKKKADIFFVHFLNWIIPRHLPCAPG